MYSDFKSTFIGYSLGLLQAFIGVTAAAGGFGLVSDPSGVKMNVSLEWLNHSPFVNYLIPGLVLLMVNGVANILAAVSTFLRCKHAANFAVALGIFLILYMTIEVWFIGLRNLSQILYVILGGAELAIGFKLSTLTAPHQIRINSTIKNWPT